MQLYYELHFTTAVEFIYQSMNMHVTIVTQTRN